MVGTLPRPILALGRVYREDCTIGHGTFGRLSADGGQECHVVHSTHVRVALNHAQMWANILQCTVEFMHVVVSLPCLPWRECWAHVGAA